MKFWFLLGLASLLVAFTKATPLSDVEEDGYISDNIGIKIDQVQAILQELADHGRLAATQLANKLIQKASGVIKHLFVKVREWLKYRGNFETYILDITGINNGQVEAILKMRYNHGKQAAIQLAKKLIEHASEALKDVLVKVLEWLEKRGDDAFVVDPIIINIDQINSILKELVEHGKQAAIQLAKKLIENNVRAVKDLLVKVLEWLESYNF